MNPAQLHEAQALVADVHAAPPLLDYVQALLAFSRQSSRFRGGLSPRAGLGLLRAARAWAVLHRRGHVLPEDVQAVLPAVVGHRLHPGDDNLEQSSAALVGQLLDAVTLPV
jgi:MoxR-like ATPase